MLSRTEKTEKHKTRRSKSRKFFYSLILATIFVGVGFGSWFNAPLKSRQTPAAIIKRIRRDLLSQPKEYGQPINMILIGSDAREDESARSDTLIFMNFNFSERRVYAVSIPRDTRVYIPGRGEDKINAAYAYGQAPLTIETVENFLELDLHHYVEVDFRGFSKLVDTLGGIDITVKEPINDRSRRYRMQIPAGRQRMNGETALNYVRYRHGDSDFARADRQQNFLTALAANVFSARGIIKLPRLVKIFNQNVSTDMSKAEMLSLGKFVREVPKKRIETITITGKSRFSGGISYVEPDQYLINDLFERIDNGRSIKAMKSTDESGKISLSQDEVTISVLNGSGRAGMAGRAKSRLATLGFRDIEMGNADRFNYDYTQVKYRPEDRAMAERVRRGLSSDAVMVPNKRSGEPVIEVIIGFDFYESQRGY